MGQNAQDSPLAWLAESPIEHPKQDRLHYQEQARMLAKHLEAAYPTSNDGVFGPRSASSIALSIEGPWGSGKTSFSNLVVHELQELAEWGPGAPVVVHYNVWLAASLRVAPWYGIAYRLGEAFYRRFHRLCISDKLIEIGHPRFSVSATEDFDQHSYDSTITVSSRAIQEPRLHWLEVAYRLSEGLRPAKNWHPCLKLFCSAPSRLAGHSLSTAEGLRTLASVGGATLSTVTGNLKGAIGGVVGASQELFVKRLTEGPDWGTDTSAFVRDLDRLLYVLHPKPRKWRAVLIVDDVTRLNADELPVVLDALGYLGSLHDIIVLMNLDDRVMGELMKYSPQGFRLDESPPGESFISRLVNLRVQVPQPQESELSQMLADHVSAISRLSHREASSFIRTFFADRPRTPRLIKRAFHWFWLRRNERPFPDEATLRSLRDFFWHAENVLSGSQVLGRLSGSPEVLRTLCRQPWDLRGWIDGFGDKELGETWEGVVTESEALIVAVRFWSVVAHFSDTEENEHTRTGSERGMQAWLAWHQALLAEGMLKEASPDWGLAQEPFMESLDKMIDRGLVPWILHARQIAAAARHSGFVASPISPSGSSRIVTKELARRLLRDYFFDLDVMWSLSVSLDEGDPEAKEMIERITVFMEVILGSG